MGHFTSDANKQSPWSSASEKGIDSLADWLIPILGRPDDFTLLTIKNMHPPGQKYLSFNMIKYHFALERLMK